MIYCDNKYRMIDYLCDLWKSPGQIFYRKKNIRMEKISNERIIRIAEQLDGT